MTVVRHDSRPQQPPVHYGCCSVTAFACQDHRSLPPREEKNHPVALHGHHRPQPLSAKTSARHDCHAQQNMLAIAAIDRSLCLPRPLRIPRRTLTTHNSHLTQHAHHGMTTPTIHGTCPAHPPFSTTTPPVALLTTAVPVRWHHGCLLQLTITY